MTSGRGLFLHDVLAGRRRGLLPSMLRAGLAPFGVAYGACAAIRRALYRRGWLKSRRLTGPVVCIGNLTAGGTGKTPLVYWAARHLLGRGHKVAILARGYGPQVGGEADDERIPPELAPFKLKRFNHPDRIVSGAEAFGDFGASCAILDDGFQHLRVRRELDVVCVDATAPLGLPLPAGLLREFPSALARADHLVLTRVDQASPEALAAIRARLARHAPGVPIGETRMRPIGLARGEATLSPDEVRGTRVVAFSGIGNPDAYERTLAQVGIEVAESVRFPDHHPYTPEELADLARRRDRAGAAMLVTTRKDVFRMAAPPPDLGVLVVGIEFVSGEEALAEAITHAVERKPLA